MQMKARGGRAKPSIKRLVSGPFGSQRSRFWLADLNLMQANAKPTKTLRCSADRELASPLWLSRYATLGYGVRILCCGVMRHMIQAETTIVCEHNPLQGQGPVSWRPTTVKWRQFPQSNRHSTIGTRQTEHHEALPSSVNVQSHLTSSFADEGNASRYSVCRVPRVEWQLDCENCRHLTVVGFRDTGPWCLQGVRSSRQPLTWWCCSCPTARCLVILGQCQDWLARCPYTVTRSDGKFALRLMCQGGSTSNL